MDIDFENSPFSGFSGLTNEEFEGLWNYLLGKNSKLPDKISILKVIKMDNESQIFAYKNGIFKVFNLVDSGVDLIKDKKFLSKIYCREQLNKIVSILENNDKYVFKIESGKSDMNSENGQSKIIKIEIYSQIDLEDTNFKNYITRESLLLFDQEIKEEKVIEVEKLKLSPYFDSIIKFPQKNNYFKLVIDENRFKLFKKIDEFWISKDFFYVIMGTNGIDKITSLLFFSSYVYKSYHVLYLNLKLFSRKNSKEAVDIFTNEMQRIFFVNKDISFNEFLDEKYIQFINLKSSIAEEFETKNKNGIKSMWLLLEKFIKEFSNSNFFSNLLIILDQYKNNNTDENYEGLNTICELIGKHSKNANFSNVSKIKLLVVISINNYDTKKMFLENANIMYFDYNNRIISDINKDKSNNNIEKNENYELLNIENFLNKNIEKINKSFNDHLSFFGNYIIEGSKSYINTIYSDITRKEYLNNNSNCKKLISKNIGNNFYHCIKSFNFSLKYFQLLVKEKLENLRQQGESDNEYEKRIVKSFYLKMFQKIKDNIEKNYKYMLKEKSSKEIVDISLKYLIKLRNNIYEEKTFLFTDIENILNCFPIKYLDVYLSCFKKLDQNQIHFGFYNFYFTYSNRFIKYAINQIINLYLKNIIPNNFDGIGFEKIVNDRILKLTFHNQKLIKRNIFSLVGITESTKDYVKKLREKENSEFYEFYKLEKVKNISIDGIDKIKIGTSVIDIKNNDIYLNQISKNGRSFDAGLLIQKDNKFDKSVTNDLILIQDTINKIINLKKKEIYINDSIKSKDYLESRKSI